MYTLTDRVTDYVCPQIVKVYSENQLMAQDIPGTEFTDDVKSLIMFRGLEKDESINGQTYEEYKKT